MYNSHPSVGSAHPYSSAAAAASALCQAAPWAGLAETASHVKNADTSRPLCYLWQFHR